MRKLGLLLAMMLAFAPALPQQAAAQERMETLRMRPGATQTTVRGIVFGPISASYRLEARAGQRMSLDLNSRNTFLYFNVLDPRGRVIAREQTQWDGRLPPPASTPSRFTWCAPKHGATGRHLSRLERFPD